MLQDRATSLANHNRFVERVLASRMVWGLRGPDGWAICDSAEYEDTQVMPFWSDSAYAARAAKDAWSDYAPAAITLDDFIDKWLRGMHEDGVLVGTNWDANNSGLEVEAQQLAGELTA
jgi:hypothetical protein